jgi:hypothetical protein
MGANDPVDYAAQARAALDALNEIYGTPPVTARRSEPETSGNLPSVTLPEPHPPAQYPPGTTTAPNAPWVHYAIPGDSVGPWAQRGEWYEWYWDRDHCECGHRFEDTEVMFIDLSCDRWTRSLLCMTCAARKTGGISRFKDVEPCAYCCRSIARSCEWWGARFCCDLCVSRWRNSLTKAARREANQKTCVWCDTPFQATRHDALWCSSACRQAAYRERVTARKKATRCPSEIRNEGSVTDDRSTPGPGAVLRAETPDGGRP